jgi:hypothetical protein
MSTPQLARGVPSCSGAWPRHEEQLTWLDVQYLGDLWPRRPDPSGRMPMPATTPDMLVYALVLLSFTDPVEVIVDAVRIELTPIELTALASLLPERGAADVILMRVRCLEAAMILLRRRGHREPTPPEETEPPAGSSVPVEDVPTQDGSPP